MSSAPAVATFLREPAASAFCADCGYVPYVDQLDRALSKLGLEPTDVAIVTDTGCIGAVDAIMTAPHRVAAMHGRSTAFAAGVELADAILGQGALKTIVVVGEGGAMVGLQQILWAASMNVDLTVLVANNGVLGLAGGLTSGPARPAPLSAADFGPALDLCAIARQCGATFVSRMAATDPTLCDVFADAVAHDGFALVEVLADCPAYGRPATTPRGESRLPLGTHAVTPTRPDFASVYLESLRTAPSDAGQTPVPQIAAAPIKRRMGLVIAGSAGDRVHMAASILARAAAMAGLEVTQRNAHGPLPATGLAVSAVCLSPEPIGDTAVDDPDIAIALSREALDELTTSGVLLRATERCLLIVDESLPQVVTDADVVRAPFQATCASGRAATTAVLFAALRRRLLSERVLLAALEDVTADQASAYREDLRGLLAGLH